MKTVNLTIIGDVACSTTRTYLSFLKNADLRPKNLWLVGFGIGSPERRLERLYYKFSKTSRRALVIHASREGSTEFRKVCEDLMKDAAVLPVDLFGAFDYEAHAECVDYFVAPDYHDALLQRRILNARDTVFLYTNGGIVPPELLGTEGVKILHMHPGVVPSMRGSDCFLWSAILMGRLGVSCFFMGAGIDDGSLISTMEFHNPNLSALTPYVSDQDDDIAYRALLFTIDPQLRGQVLVDVLLRNIEKDLHKLPATPQALPLRPAHLWMHPMVRRSVLRKVVARKPSHPSGRVYSEANS